MSRKKIDMMEITDVGEIRLLKDMDFLKCGVPFWLVKEGECENIFYDILDYVFIFRELSKTLTYSDFAALYFMKMFDLIYPLILLAYKKYLIEYHERMFLKNENEKLRKEVKGNECR